MWQTIGQNKIVTLLQRGLQHGLSHAYLVVGPAHSGKMTLALDLARALNCRGENPPCGECPTCRKIGEGKHADVQVIGLGQGVDAEDGKARAEIGIAQIQEVIHSANLPPFEGTYRVYIIDEAGQLSNEAANCLLKTLEEPKGKVVFVLLTTNPRLIPVTVISRCQKLEFASVSLAEIEEALTGRWKAEGEKARLLARICHGCLGWAIEALNNPALLQQRGERFEKLISLMRNGFSERFDVAAQMAAQFNKKRETVYEILALWLDWWHDLLLVKSGSHAGVNNIDYRPALDEMAGSYSLAQIRNAIQDIREAGEQLKLNVNARLVLETLMLNLPKTGVEKSGKQFEVKNA